MWYQKAADLGYTLAMLGLGFKYATGEGVIRDASEAYAWFNVAAAKGETSAREAIDLIRERMSAEQVVAGQKRFLELLKRTEKVQAKKK